MFGTEITHKLMLPLQRCWTIDGKHIMEAVMNVNDDDNGIVRNYITNMNGHGPVIKASF